MDKALFDMVYSAITEVALHMDSKQCSYLNCEHDFKNTRYRLAMAVVRAMQKEST